MIHVKYNSGRMGIIKYLELPGQRKTKEIPRVRYITTDKTA
jgi:hypothetical protein